MNTLESFSSIESQIREKAKAAWEEAGFTKVKIKMKLNIVAEDVTVTATGFFPGATTSFDRGSYFGNWDIDWLAPARGNIVFLYEDFLDAARTLIKERQSA